MLLKSKYQSKENESNIFCSRNNNSGGIRPASNFSSEAVVIRRK